MTGWHQTPKVWLDQSCNALWQNCSGVCRNAMQYPCPKGTLWNGLKIAAINHNLNLDCDRRLSSFSQNWSYYSIIISMAQWQSVVISVVICEHLTSILQSEGVATMLSVPTYLNVHPGKRITFQHFQIQKESSLKSSPWGRRLLEEHTAALKSMTEMLKIHFQGFKKKTKSLSHTISEDYLGEEEL